MKKKPKRKRTMSVTEAQRKEMQESWLSAKYLFALMASFYIADAITAADLRDSTPVSGWIWALAVLGTAGWLYRYTARILLLDMKERVRITLYPFLLEQWKARIKLTSMMKLFLFYIPIAATVRMMGQGTHTGYVFFASIYLGLGLFVLVVTTGRQWVQIGWLQKVTEGIAYQQVKGIKAIEDIDAPGWYVLGKNPLWVIRIIEEEGGYVADVQVEAAAGWRPVCDRAGRPKRVKSIQRLVRELRRVEAAWDASLDEISANAGVSV